MKTWIKEVIIYGGIFASLNAILDFAQNDPINIYKYLFLAITFGTTMYIFLKRKKKIDKQ